MHEDRFLIRVSVSGDTEAVPVPAGEVPQEILCTLLQTDVTERLRLSETPEMRDASAVLCYLIDARGGDRGLPVNSVGTCFYHTGCPVFGDLLIGSCMQEHAAAAVFGFSAADRDLLLQWLTEQFPFCHAD